MNNRQLIRSDTDYAIRILVCLALRRKQGAIPVAILAGAQKVPIDFAYKVLRKLGKSGLVRSVVGPGGGFSLAGEPRRISLLDIMESVQGKLSIRPCLLDDNSCALQPSCPVSHRLMKLQDRMEASLRSITLAAMVRAKSGKAGPKKPGKLGEKNVVSAVR